MFRTFERLIDPFEGDGLTEPVEDALIEETLASSSDPDAAAHQLVALALERGGPDNVTAIVARYAVEDIAD